MKKIKTSDLILLLLGVFLLIFTAVCLILFSVTGNEPSTLITAVFGLCGCECGIMGWIKNVKTKNNTEGKSDGHNDDN